VSSVGLAAFAALLVGDSDDDPLFLQVKQAEASILERFLSPSAQPSHGSGRDRPATSPGRQRHLPRLDGR
jgi:hypothetical protein